jgi:hypothetical protein
MSVSVRFITLFAFAAFTNSANAQAPVKRIAVLSFQEQSPQSSVGRRITDGLISALAGSGNFQVVDRANLDRVEKEQNLRYADRFSAEGAAKLGKLLNVNVLIIGQVDTASAAHANENTGSKVVQSEVIDVKATAQMISVETATIMLAPSAESHQKGVLAETITAAPAPVAPVAPGTLGGVMRSLGGLAQSRPKPQSQDPIVTEAQLVDRAINEVTAQLAAKISAQLSVPTASVPVAPVAPKFVGIEDGLIIVNKGQNAGIKVGDAFVVSRSTDIGFKDPDTGKPILRKKQQCTLTITVVEESISSGKCEGPGVPQAGDEFTPAPRQ